MGISGITANLMDSLSDFNIKDLLRGKKAKDLMGEVSVDALADSAVLAAQKPVAEIQEQTGSLVKSFQNYSGQSDNMMARNFASTSDDTSRYIAARLDSFSSATMMKQAEESSVTSLLDEFGGIAGPSMYDPHGNRKSGGESEATIRRKLLQKAGKKIIEDAEEDFKKTREHLEEKAEEATAPKDENGNPIPNITDLNPTPAPLPEVTASPTPEAVSAPDAAPLLNAAPAAVSVPEPVVEVATPATPAAPRISIDIRV